MLYVFIGGCTHVIIHDTIQRIFKYNIPILVGVPFLMRVHGFLHVSVLFHIKWHGQILGTITWSFFYLFNQTDLWSFMTRVMFHHTSCAEQKVCWRQESNEFLSITMLLHPTAGWQTGDVWKSQQGKTHWRRKTAACQPKSWRIIQFIDLFRRLICYDSLLLWKQ